METQHTTPRKTKLLYVVESFSTGVYAIVRDIACNLDPEAFTVRILHSLRPDSPKTYEEDFAQPHISLQYIPMGSLKTYRRAVGAIREAIRTFEPDAIHLHSSKAGVLGRLAAKGSFSKRLLYSPHGF
ncbi:MAG TPA: glycosyltransferase, partial [Sphaerochaetaceae bacterium]|nr:glycosyltransferase [Sphaerochaetaceae bacterium]